MTSNLISFSVCVLPISPIKGSVPSPARKVPVYSDLNMMKVYPNPVKTGSMHYSRVVFDNIPIGSNIKIYDIAGQLIKELETRDSSSNKVMWFLDNANDSKIASGVYIYFVEFRGKVKSGKIAVVR